MNQEYILLIMNCVKYRYKAERQKTWLKDLPPFLIYFHVIGNPDLQVEYEFVNNILYVKTQDDYNSLPKKVIAAYHAIAKSYKFKYIFKTDDDQHLTNINFLNIVKNLLDTVFPKIHYGGFIIHINEPYLSEYYKIHPELPKNLPIMQTQYCSGRFYILSDLAVQQLIHKRIDIEKEYLEDYAIGLHLHPTLKHNMLNIQTPLYFTDLT